MDDTYDVIVIGAGPVGQNVTERSRAAGLSVAVVERELVGGECSYWGCVPSKALLRPVLAVADARKVDGAREAVDGSINADGVFGRRDRYTTNYDDTGQANWVKATGADLIRGHGRLDGPRRVAVATPDDKIVTLTARHAVAICIGSTAALPDLPGIAEARPWTNRRATDSSSVPDRLAVVGGGGVAVEMATAWRGLGAEVTLLARRSGLLPRMEPFVGELVDAWPRGGGCGRAGRRLDHRAAQARWHRTGRASRSTTAASWRSTRCSSPPAGRRSRNDIGLETVGLTPGSWLDVDDTCRVRDVADGWLYAMGDANHRALLTHQGKYQARMAAGAIAARAAGQPVDTAPWGRHTTTADTHAVPQVFFTDPEAAAVGLSATQAEQAGYRTRVVDVEIGEVVPGAKFYADGYTGRARMVVDLDAGTLLGVTFVGPGVGEMLHSATIAVAGQVPVDRLWHAVPCFPTISEVWLRLMEAYRDE